MFAKIRSLTKQTAVYGIGTIAARAVAFLLLPYYSHLMTPAEYGVFTLFLIFVGIMQPLYMHGMDISLLRFSAAAERPEQRRDLGFVLLQTLMVGGVISTLIAVFSPQVARLVVSESSGIERDLALMSAAVLLTDTLGFHIFTSLRIRRKPLLFSAFKLGNVLLTIALNIYLVGTLRLGAFGGFLAFLISSAATLLGLLWVVRREISLHWTRSQLAEWLTFGLPNVPSMLFIMILEFSDRKWIEALMGVDEAGIYSAGYRLGMFMNMVAQAFRYAWQPFFLQTAKDEDAKLTYARVLTYFLMATGWMWLGMALLLEPLLKLPLPGIGPLIDPRFWAGFSVFPVVMLAHIFNGIYANFMVGVYLEKKTKIIPLVVGIAAAVNVAGNGFLIPIYGWMASAWLTVASYAIIAVGIFLYINRRYPVPYEWGRIVQIAVSVALMWGIAHYVLPEGHAVWWDILIVALLPMLWIRFLLTSAEKSGFRRWWKSRRGVEEEA